MNSSTGWVVVAFLAASSALAQPAPDVTSVSIEVGETASVDVGLALGLVCDDLSVVGAQMLSGTDKSNRLVLTGLKEGKTLCRVGNDQLGSKRFVQVTVTPAHGRQVPKR